MSANLIVQSRLLNQVVRLLRSARTTSKTHKALVAQIAAQVAMRVAVVGWCWAILLWAINPVVAQDSQWPQWRGPQRDDVLAYDNYLEKFPADGPEELWSAALGPGYTGPTIADDRVFVMDRITDPKQQERVICLDAKTGIRLWEHVYDCLYSGVGYEAGPRASVCVDDNRAYSLGTMGHLICFDVGGAVLWEKNLDQEYKISESQRMPIWGIAASPLVYKNLLIVQVSGADGACMVGFDKKSGEEVWRALDDRAQYSSPIIVQQAGQDVCVIWTGDSVAGLDPLTGKVHWRFPFTPRNMPIGIATPIVKDNLLYVTSFYDGSLMLKLNQDAVTAEKVWAKIGTNERKTDALHSIISTPVWIGQHIYGVDSYGEFRCLEAASGDRVWEDQTAVPKARWSTVHFTQFPNADSRRVWMFNERGELLLGELSPDGFREIDRAFLIKPTTPQLNQRGGVCWTHPAYTKDTIVVRNDEAIKCFRISK